MNNLKAPYYPEFSTEFDDNRTYFTTTIRKQDAYGAWFKFIVRNIFEHSDSTDYTDELKAINRFHRNCYEALILTERNGLSDPIFKCKLFPIDENQQSERERLMPDVSLNKEDNKS